MLKKNHVFAVVMLLAMLLTGCGSAPADDYAPATSTTPVAITAPELEVEVEEPVAESEEPVQSEDPAQSEEPEQSEDPAQSEAPESGNPEAGSDDPAPSSGSEYHRPTPEERRLGTMEMFLDYCSTQATVETSRNACVVDVRTAENPYDVVWDYGPQYNRIVNNADWSLVFDAAYYMEQFPMLTRLYNYDEELLLQHFQTVGVHEGRQGSAGFNVADYMSKCAVDVRELYGDCYAAYYFHWMSIETDRTMDVSGKNQPKQMVAVLTAMQARELQQVNALREKLGVDPLVFDSELAAMGNFRGWVDAEEDWQLHDWLHEHTDEAYDMLRSFGGSSAGENTVKSYSAYPKNWYERYYNSKSHYDAMVNSEYSYIGCSNAYLGNCAHKGAGIVMVEFDMFAKTVSTALNP